MINEASELLRKLNDPEMSVRLHALDEVGTRKLADARPILVRYLSDPEVEIRVAAACNLGDLGDPAGIPYLIRASQEDTSEKVRGEALAAMSAFNTPDVLSVLVSEVHREKRSRRPRQEVAKQLGNYDSEEAVDALILLLGDEDVFVREYAAESLFRLNRPRLAEVWRRATTDQSADVRDVAKKAIQRLW